ncbi:MAG: RidA family protein [Armatimonadetes bacterium]|jgi:Putative translation initiation inhibitor, yjgF family|uniref:Enamine deaminase RidA n=1 Tax=Candidatus Nitrosymbiomonas proteolyticus TaxID=2608984 RepID=A0A809S640_9BACT|nr:MAG: RidA family protein [Armatimonadota bacterium]MBV6491744.1 putative aminoacrylate peracid reductase RutC [Fimbriimonadaceae bacterium]QOJ12602.1 MAG: RidA family protein [Chthonomonadaceae bacterium]BBO24496.1 enamine deaminase RidA [Candidatus Nitrosymbiomonas proteolyticus]MBL1151511.1 RidA family protein [Armatimonadota bacterium]
MGYERRLYHGPSPYEAVVGFARAVRVNDMVYVSGSAPIGEDGRVACPGDPYGQALRCIEIIRQALEGLGARLEDVVRTRIYIVDRLDYPAVCQAHAEAFGAIQPASTLIVVAKLLEEQWRLEIEAEAIVGSGAVP